MISRESTPLNDLIFSISGDFIIADQLPAYTYKDFQHTTLRVGNQLDGLGISQNDVICSVINNGPLAATSFLAIANHATSAPLNPNFTYEEFKYYLKDLNTKILITEGDHFSLANKAAEEIGIEIITLQKCYLPGDFYLSKDGKELSEGTARLNSHSDTALVLHTSGTTSKPKIVNLTSNNICISAENISRTLQLKPEDKYLNIMPLFHIHGLIAGVLSTVTAGASMICTHGFDALKFFNQIEMFQPSWYSAVPTMHQAILARSTRNTKIIKKNKLRFIRSSSASLPIPTLEDLERTFNCPVIEAYGMTEAAHQMASNPLPPRKRKVGTVGLAAGPEIRVITASGEYLSANQTGEIVIKGKNVTPGYKNNVKANAESFIKGWFRTGDQGFFDSDGYLTISGRLKEIINRGGEKISPKEVDEILMKHPSVSQAVTFSIPHQKLGEDVAAAIVCSEKCSCTQNELKTFVKGYLAPFKVPRKIFFLKEIPKGSTGKLHRLGLAKKLGLLK